MKIVASIDLNLSDDTSSAHHDLSRLVQRLRSCIIHALIDEKNETLESLSHSEDRKQSGIALVKVYDEIIDSIEVRTWGK